MAKVSQASAERAIKSAYAISFLQGIIAISLVPRVPELVAQLRLDFAGWGVLIGAVSLSSLLPLVLANKLIMRFGTRPIMSLGGIAFAGSLAFIPWCNSAWEFAIVAMLQTVAGATFNIALQSATVMLQKKLKKTVIGNVHASWSIGATISAALSGALVAAGVSFKLHFGLAAVIAALGMFIASCFLLAPNEDGHLSEQKHVEKISWLKTPWYVWLLTAGFVVGAWCESMMTDWSALFSEQVLGIDSGHAAIAYAAFSGSMILGRLSIGPLTKKRHISNLAMIGSVVGFIGIAGGVLLGPPLIQQNLGLGMIVVCFFWICAGIGSAAMVPSFFSAAGHVKGMATAQVLARMSFASVFIFMALKSAIGVVANLNLQIAMLTPMIAFILAGLISSLVTKRAKLREKEMVEAYPMTGVIPVVTTKQND